MEKEFLPHGPFEKLDDRLWILKGELPAPNPLPRTMTVFKMADGGLWIHSAIALDESGRRELESLGEPRILVVPNTMHRLDAPFYKEMYPNIRVVCPAAAVEKVSEKVRVDATCESEFANSEIRVDAMDGAKAIELAYEVPLASGGRALIFNDLIANLRKVDGVGGFLLKALGRIGFFRTPPITKLVLLENRKAFRGWLERQSRRSDIRVITVAHGDAVRDRAPELLHHAALQV